MCLLIYLLCFLIYTVLQSWFINGVHDAFKGSKHIDEKERVTYHGMIFYRMAPKFFERHRGKAWTEPFWGCVKCMASVWGALSYWPLVIYVFRFHWSEVFVFGLDVFILVYLNKYFYSKI